MTQNILLNLLLSPESSKKPDTKEMKTGVAYTVAFVYQIQPGFHTRTCGVKQTKTLLYLEHFVFRGSLLRMQSAA